MYVDSAGRHRWHCFAGNGRLLCKSTRGFGTRDEAKADINFLVTHNPGAMLYRDRKGQWRWRCVCDGRSMAVSTEAYINRSDCAEASELFLKSTLA
jgi:uncharacterized protein YegP (UPF0339 family)